MVPTDVADPWGVEASRALHPSSAHTDGPLVVAIAAGLASVAVPAEWTAPPSSPSTADLLLSTDRYDAWLVRWSPGAVVRAVDLGEAGTSAVAAVAVVSGSLDEQRRTADGSITSRRLGVGGATWFAVDTDDVTVADGAHVGATSVVVCSPPIGELITGRTPVPAAREALRWA